MHAVLSSWWNLTPPTLSCPGHKSSHCLSHPRCIHYPPITLGQKHSIYRVQHYLQFQASTAGLGTYPPWIREDYCSSWEFAIDKTTDGNGKAGLGREALGLLSPLLSSPSQRGKSHGTCKHYLSMSRVSTHTPPSRLPSPSRARASRAQRTWHLWLMSLRPRCFPVGLLFSE